MLKSFSVCNYKRFESTVNIDFGKVGGYQFNTDCIYEDTLAKCILYGRNATGKTCFGLAIMDICDVLSTSNYYYIRESRILNSNSDEKYASFEYEFYFNQTDVKYIYSKNDNNEMCKEQLFIEDKQVFEVDFENNIVVASGLSLIGAETIQFKKYVEMISEEQKSVDEDGYLRTPFLRYILNNAALNKKDILVKLEDYVQRMRYSATGKSMRGYAINSKFNEYLGEEDNKQDFENFLNMMGVDCRLKLIENIEGRKELYFDYKRPLPFYENASSGTVALVNFYRRFIASNIRPSFIYMDEFDAFAHYEMAEKTVEFLKKYYPECQVVLTTHNTNLMSNEIMRPDCLFLISSEGGITPLCRATGRELREGHNLEKLYIAGEFEQYE